MRFFWILLNQLAYATFSKYLPYRGVGDCRYTVLYSRGKIRQAIRNTRAQIEYDRWNRTCGAPTGWVPRSTSQGRPAL